MVLLVVELGSIRRGEMTIVFRTHRVLFLVERRFLRFQICSLAGSELAAVYALRDAILLVFLSFLNRLSVHGGRGGRLRGNDRSRHGDQQSGNGGRATQNKCSR